LHYFGDKKKTQEGEFAAPPVSTWNSIDRSIVYLGKEKKANINALD